MKKEIKRYLVSSLITFLAVFIPALIQSLIDANWSEMTMASILALVFVALRGAIKVAWELLVPLFADLLKWAKDNLSK